MKRLFLKMLGYNNYRYILVKLMRLLNNKHKKIWIHPSVKHKIIKSNDKNIFYGYYDHNSINNDNAIYIKTKHSEKQEALICCKNIVTEKEYILYKTKAWNYQIASRLRWLDDKTIIFNDYDNNLGFISVKKDIKSNSTEIYNFPIYDIDNKKEYSFYLNFSILEKYRTGYGYINEIVDNKEIDDNNNGIYKGSFKDNKQKLILSIEDIINYQSSNYIRTNSINYINHISCSPYSDKLLFSHLYYDKNNKEKSRVFIINNNGIILNVIDDFDKASHYCWRDENHVLLTIMNKGKCEYRLYNIETNNYKEFDFLTVDGHPTYITKDKFITDTYPDHNGMQHLYLCDEYGILTKLVEIYHNPKKTKKYRSDLHPNYSNNYILFDSIPNRNKELNIINISDINNLKLLPYGSENNWKKQLYMFLNNRIEVINIKYIYSKIFSYKYKAHLLAYKMIKTKNKLLKELRFNKLQRKYSICISPKFKCDNFIHFMHLNGIVIGSDVKIGRNCKIYQQVTLGKNKGYFPILKDNVTIYAGAKVLGKIELGNNVIVGANAVVLDSVKDNHNAVGIPARTIRKKDI